MVAGKVEPRGAGKNSQP